MIIVFCEECGAKNMIDEDKIDPKKSHIKCSVCHDLILISQAGIKNYHDRVINTKQYKILIIDDDPTSLHILSSILKTDYTVIMAENGGGGIEIAKKENPDLIITDIKMPGMDGYDICKKLKDDEITRHVPIIFVSSMNDILHERKGFDVGGVDYIMKPIISSTLKARVGIHLELKLIRDKMKKSIGILNQEIADLKAQLESGPNKGSVNSGESFEIQSPLDTDIQNFFDNVGLHDSLIISEFVDEIEKSFHKLDAVEYLELFFKMMDTDNPDYKDNDAIELINTIDIKPLKDAVTLLMFKKAYEKKYGTKPEIKLSAYLALLNKDNF